jgi:hypothetical protein
MFHPGLLAFTFALLALTAGGRAAFGALAGENYVMAAAAAEQCTGRRLTMVEEMRLAQVLRREGMSTASSLDVSDALAKARAQPALSCEAPAVREQITLFTQTILPQLQGPPR